MKKSKLLLSIVLLGAGLALILQQYLEALSLVALAVFIVVADGSFEEVPPTRERGKPYLLGQEIRRYREENSGASVAQAVEALGGGRGSGRTGQSAG